MEFTETSLFFLLFNEFTPWGHSRKSRINLGFSRKIHGDPPLGKAVLIPANPAQVPASALPGKAPSISQCLRDSRPAPGAPLMQTVG